MFTAPSEGSTPGKYYEISGDDVFSIPSDDIPAQSERADLQVIALSGPGIAWNRTGEPLLINPKIKEFRAKDGTSLKLTRNDMKLFRAKSLDGSAVGFRIEFRSKRILKN